MVLLYDFQAALKFLLDEMTYMDYIICAKEISLSD